jgi:hypothetical protein
MCRFAISIVVALAVIGSFASRAARAEEAKCEGTIMKIDGENVTVKTATNQEHHLLVVPATKIMLDGKAAKPNDLKVGQHVKCTANKEGDKMTCNMIEAHSRTP